MRAGPLSDTAVIQFLNDNFVNTWVLKPTLPVRRDKAAAADTRRLASAVLDARQKGSPVDCLVLSADAALIAVRSYHDMRGADRTRGYRAFLEEALGKVKK